MVFTPFLRWIPATGASECSFTGAAMRMSHKHQVPGWKRLFRKNLQLEERFLALLFLVKTNMGYLEKTCFILKQNHNNHHHHHQPFGRIFVHMKPFRRIIRRFSKIKLWTWSFKLPVSNWSFKHSHRKCWVLPKRAIWNNPFEKHREQAGAPIGPYFRILDAPLTTNKNNLLLVIESWLFNTDRDPYHGWLQSLHKWVVESLIDPKQPSFCHCPNDPWK